MNDFEPIELEILIKSGELLEEFKKMTDASNVFDDSIDQTKKKFNEFVQSQLKANGVLSENASLTEKQTNALKRHYEMLDQLKAQIAKTTDPTQLGVYNYQLKQAEQAIKDIVTAANTKVELLNTAQLEEQNRKLEQAGRVLDQIAEKSFEFADPKELEVLSQAINEAENEMDQLGVLLDFISAKMQAMDKDSDLFKELQKDIETANKLLERMPTLYDTTGNSIFELEDILIAFKGELKEATDPNVINMLNQNIENIETAINKMKNAGKTGFDELGNKIVEQKTKTEMLRTELQKLIQNMSELRLENKANSEEYARFRDRATEIRSALATINQEVNSGASSTGGLDTLIRVTASISSGFALAQGSAALFGNENENVAKTIQKVTGAMAVLQSMQHIQAELKRADSLATKAQTMYQSAYNVVVGQSTGALKTFRIALAATGVGAFILLLAALITNWDKVKKAIGLTSDALERNQAISKKANDLYGDQIGKIRMLVELSKQEGLTTRQKEKAVKDFNKEFGNTLGSVKDYAELEKRIIANAPKYIEYLNVKAQAEAAYILSLEKQKNLLEQITALSTGDLKWYEKLQNFSDKASDKFWGMFGVKTDTKYDVSTEEQLRILGLPTEAEFNKAIQGYSAVIQDNLKDLRKQQSEDNQFTSAYLDLSKKASELAEKNGIYGDEKKPKGKTDQVLKDRLSLLQEITKAENDYFANSLSGLDKDLKEIEQKYAKMRAEAEKLRLSNKDIGRIDKLETKEKALVTYKDNTDQLVKQLEKEKELYKLYEQAKTLIGADEITKRHEEQLKGFETFGDRLRAEIANIEQTPEADRTGAESERLNKLLEYQRQYEKELQEIQDDRYLNAYESTLTLQERIQLIENEYAQKRLEIGKITDEKLRNQKLTVLNQQQKDAVNAARNEEFQIRDSRKRIFETALGLTKKEFKTKLTSLEEYLQASGDLLDDDTKKGLENEIERGKSLLKMTDLSRDEKILLDQKAKLIDEIKNGQVKGTDEMDKQLAAIEEINVSLDIIAKEKMKLFAERAYQVSDGMMLFANAVRSGNEDLAKTIETIAEIANDIGNIVNAFSKGLVDGLVSLVVTVVKWIVSIFTNAKKNREEDRKLMEEVKRFQAEAYQAQLDYNKEVRERWMYEARINDLYTSRITNIKEELAVLKKQKESVAEDMQTVFDRLLGSETIVDKGTTNKKFLGIKRKKKRAWEASANVADLLGLEQGAEITDEIFERLRKLNAERPLTGDAKEAYEQLLKLKEEYGSIDDIMQQLEIDYKNAITGTTAQAIGDSIRDGLASGKRSFADFADDIEGFLRNAILAGLESDFFAEKVQQLQDVLAGMMEDGVLTESERKQFEQMYMNIVNQSKAQMDMLNQAGIDISGNNQQNSLKGAIKGITEEQAELLAGQFGGLRLAQLETNQILKSSAAYQMQACSDMIKIQGQIEINTRKSADVLELIYKHLGGTYTVNSTNSLTANGF